MPFLLTLEFFHQVSFIRKLSPYTVRSTNMFQSDFPRLQEHVFGVKVLQSEYEIYDLK